MKEFNGPLRDADLVFHGVAGEHVDVQSANPINYYEAITKPADCAPVTLAGKLFLPHESPQAVVMIVPGSLGVGPNHLTHAETLVGAGIGAFVLDPFGARAVESTIANQVQYSFAASAFDVLSALKVLDADPRVDSKRISAQGHSRGGSAVTMAAMRRFADPIVGTDVGFAGVYAVYPWCGQQFLDPRIGSTRFRAIVGERDEWVSVQQMQAQTHAIRLAGGDASDLVVAGAHHSFDRLEAVHTLEDAAVTPAAPTTYIADDGAMIDPRRGDPDPSMCDRDTFIASIKGGHGKSGAAIGGQDGEPELFREDMLRFHRETLGN